MLSKLLYLFFPSDMVNTVSSNLLLNLCFQSCSFYPYSDNGPIMHLDIKNNKIWIQQNTTEVDIALELIEMGVPKQDIVISFHTQKMRQLSGFAVE